MTDTVYIIGNGFDRHHGIRSAYADFANYLRARDSKLYHLLEEYFETNDEFWSKFEARLATFDANTLIEHASAVWVPYGADDWKDSYHHDYQFEIEQVVDTLSNGLKSRFAEWIRGLEIPDRSTIPSRLLRLNTGAVFLNFNYTPSLTKLYGIGSEQQQVCYIHGCAAQGDDLILGHAWNPTLRGSLNDDFDPEETDARVTEGNEIIDAYFERTFKATDRVIRANEPFFERLRGLREILVMGHSLGDVDLAYFKEIVRGNAAARWRISYYDGAEPARFRVQLEKLGVPPHAVEFARLCDM